MDRVIRKQNFLVAFVILIIFVCGVFISSSALAQEEENYTGLGIRASNGLDDLTNIRTIFKYKLNPNDKKQDSLYVDNSMKTDAKIRLYAVDGQNAEGGAYGCNNRGATNSGVGNWIKFEKSELELKPKEKGDFKFSLAIPANAEVGEHSGCVVMERVGDEGEENQGGATIKLRNAIRVSVMVPGDVKRQVSIGRFNFGGYEEFTVMEGKVQKKIFMGVFPVEIVNEGNVSASVKKNITIKNLFGGVVHSIDGHVLSLPSYKFKDASGKDQKYDGRLMQKLIMNQNDRRTDFKPFWGGFYKATLRISYDKHSSRVSRVAEVNKNDLVHKEETITVFFWPSLWAIAIIITIILASIISIWWFFRKKNKKSNNDKPKQKTKILWGKYTVKDGETLRILADKHDVTLARMAKINKISPGEKIKVGQVVYVPKKRVEVSEEK